MEEKTTGKRLAVSDGGKKKTPYIIAGAVAALLVAGYVALCFAASGVQVWPHTSVLGVDVSGTTPEGAAEKVRMALDARWQGESISFVRDGQVVETLNPVGLMESVDVAQALRQTQEGGFLTRGARYVASLMGKENDLTVPLDWTPQGQSDVEAAIASIAQKLGVSGNETTWTVGETDVTFTKGYTAARVDTGALLNGIRSVLTEDDTDNSVPITVEEAPPAEPDFQTIRDGLYVEPVDAYLDRESGEIVESVTGKDLDIETARLALAATAEGKSCRVPLDLSEPVLTTENLTGLLFRDVLGEAVTYVSGTSDRIMNVGHAADFVNGTIVFPGEEFSFNQTCSPYAVSNGYGKATAYVNGLSKDTVAGGICQASSTLYWAMLKANLQTVERNAHRYEPSYIKGGLDATVYGDYGEEGGLDFRFINNTEHPIKLEGYLDKSRYLHMTIKGTDTTGVHGEPYSANRIITKAYETRYEADAAVPQGTIKKDSERTGYTGVNIDTYQKLLDGEGKVLSETKLYTSKYKVRNEVLLYNPADAELWGIDPATGIRTEPVIEPVESGEITEPTPAVTGEPVVTETPAEPTSAAEPSEEPDLPPWVEPTPEVIGPPANPDPTPDPIPEPTPVETPGGVTDPGTLLPPGNLTTGEEP